LTLFEEAASFIAIMKMTSIFGTRGVLALIFVLTICTRLAWDTFNRDPLGGPWPNGVLAHNIINDGHWFEVNANAGPRFSFNAPLKGNGRLVAPAEANLTYSDAHPRWVPFAAEPVGEAVLLAGVWEATGSQTYLPDVLMKVVLDAFAALLVYRIAMRLFRRRRAALVAGLLYALYPPMAEVVVNSNSDFWSVDLTIAIVAVYLEAINSTRPGRWLLACGVLTGISAYFHPGVLILPGALALSGIAVAGWRTTLRRAFVTTTIAALLIVPWMIRNYDDFHAIFATRPSAGEALWVGLQEVPNHYGTLYSSYQTYQMMRRIRPDLHWLTPGYDSYLGGRARAVVEHHPLFYLKLVARRVWISTLGEVDSEWMHGGTTTPFAYPRGPIAYAIEQPLQLLQVALMPFVFLLAMLSLVFTWARYKHEHLLLVAAALANAAPYFLLHFEPRYMIPMAISYLIWIGLGADLLAEHLGSISVGRAAVVVEGRARYGESSSTVTHSHGAGR
jgi:4-amino-4-deoxy-L-arabinose transferase-like glycosyltransferase